MFYICYTIIYVKFVGANEHHKHNCKFKAGLHRDVNEKDSLQLTCESFKD